MPGNARLNPDSMAVEIDFVQAVHTPTPVMKFGIELHLAGFSLSNTVEMVDIAEMFKPVLADRVIFRLVNRCQLTAVDFE